MNFIREVIGEDGGQFVALISRQLFRWGSGVKHVAHSCPLLTRAFRFVRDGAAAVLSAGLVDEFRGFTACSTVSTPNDDVIGGLPTSLETSSFLLGFYCVVGQPAANLLARTLLQLLDGRELIEYTHNNRVDLVGEAVDSSLR